MKIVQWLGAVAAVSAALGAWAMPSRGDLMKVQSTVNELMAGDMKSVKAGGMKQKEAADHAVGYAREATDEASKFLFYKGAFGLYMKGGDYADALRALDLLRREVKDVPDKVLLEIIGARMKNVPREGGGEIIALYESLDRKLRAQGEVARLEAALKANPKDAEARRQLAQKRAQLGDWKAALDEFAALGGADGKAAKTEKGGKTKAAADAWWEFAANLEEDEQALYRRHAADLYRAAVAQGGLAGIQKSLAQKRADEYPASGPAVAAPRPEAPAAETADARPAAGGVTVSRVPGRQGQGMTLRLKLGVPLEFVHCPAGTYTKALSTPFGVDLPAGHRKDGPHKVTISRPFYMTRTPVTLAQYWTDATSRKWSDFPKERRFTALQLPELGYLKGDAAVPVGTYNGNFLHEILVSPDRVERWAEELTKRFAKDLPRGYAVRLPTEAEYEYAVRAGSDDTADLFVNPNPDSDELRRLSPNRKLDFVPIVEKRGLTKDQGIHMFFLMSKPVSGYPAPVASRQANAWGIFDGWNYLTAVLTADRWIFGREFPYSVIPAPQPVPEGAVDPLFTVPKGKLAGNVVYWTVGNLRGGRELTLCKPSRNSPVGPGLFGADKGFFLVIAPDLSTLNAITPEE